MHRADPHANRPSPRSRGPRDYPPRGGPPSSHLTRPPDPGPAPPAPQRAPGANPDKTHPTAIRIGSYRVHALDVITVVLGIAVLLAIFWPH